MLALFGSIFPLTGGDLELFFFFWHATKIFGEKRIFKDQSLYKLRICDCCFIKWSLWPLSLFRLSLWEEKEMVIDAYLSWDLLCLASTQVPYSETIAKVRGYSTFWNIFSLCISPWVLRGNIWSCIYISLVIVFFCEYFFPFFFFFKNISFYIFIVLSLIQLFCRTKACQWLLGFV